MNRLQTLSLEVLKSLMNFPSVLVSLISTTSFADEFTSNSELARDSWNKRPLIAAESGVSTSIRLRLRDDSPGVL